MENHESKVLETGDPPALEQYSPSRMQEQVPERGPGMRVQAETLGCCHEGNQ